MTADEWLIYAWLGLVGALLVFSVLMEILGRIIDWWDSIDMRTDNEKIFDWCLTKELDALPKQIDWWRFEMWLAKELSDDPWRQFRYMNTLGTTTALRVYERELRNKDLKPGGLPPARVNQMAL